MVDFEELTPAQKEAARHKDGALMVFAGAGTGKTTVLENRYEKLVESGVSKDDILLTSFTRKAVNEIRERIDVVGQGEHLDITTLHGTFYNLVEENKEALGYEDGNSSLNLLDNGRKRRVKSLLRERLDEARRQEMDTGEELIKETAEVIEHNIDLMRRKLYSLEEADKHIENGDFQIVTEIMGEEKETLRNLDRLCKNIIPEYKESLIENHEIDFTGMQFDAYKLLKSNQRKLQRYQQKWDYIMVDEAQDLSLLQWKLVDLLAEEHRNLTLIGDDAQAIYGWRGSDYEYMHDFSEKYDAEVVMLETSFRSSDRILTTVNRVARSLEGGVSEKILESNKGSRSESRNYPKLVNFQDFGNEAYGIANEIERLHHEEDVEYDDIGVVTRRREPLGTINNVLERKEIPALNEKAYPFAARNEIKYYIRFLRAFADPKDSKNLETVIEEYVKGFGESTIRRLKQEKMKGCSNMLQLLENLRKDNEVQGVGAKTVARGRKFVKFIRNLDSRDDPYEAIRQKQEDWKNSIESEMDWDSERQRRVDELKGMIQETAPRFEKDSISDAIERVELLAGEDPEDKVILTTVHGAKGREWDTVFLPEMNEGYFPNNRSDDLEEEKRLLYVAVSRAKHRLYLSFSNEINDYSNSPSPFLELVFEDGLEVLNSHQRTW